MNADRLLAAQRELTSSFTPEGDEPKLGRVELGAIGIFGEVSGNRSFEAAYRKWRTVARPLTKDRHRAEAKACLLFASF